MNKWPREPQDGDTVTDAYGMKHILRKNEHGRFYCEQGQTCPYYYSINEILEKFEFSGHKRQPYGLPTPGRLIGGLTFKAETVTTTTYVTRLTHEQIARAVVAYFEIKDGVFTPDSYGGTITVK